MTENYSHRRLKDDRSFRLLKFKTKSILREERSTLEYELISASLDTAPAYSAVSYAWDAQTPTSSTICESKLLLITTNCEGALNYLSREMSPDFLWVDSICIDQTNIDERNKQVGLMAEIYRKAKNVFIWLGQGDEESAIAMETLEELAQLAKLSPEAVEWKFKKMQESTRSQVLTRFKKAGIPLGSLLPEAYLPWLHLMNAISGRSWFQRIWTLQEIVLAKEAVLICGNHSISWESLSQIAEMITECDASSGLTQYPGDEFQRVRVVSMLRGLLGVGPPPRAISYQLPAEHPFGSIKMDASINSNLPVLGIASHFFLASCLLCFDLKDRVYGLYAILQQYGINLQQPDYNKSVQVIYTETARALIEHDSSLELLYYVSCQRIMAGLPSWVPDPSHGWLPWMPGFEFTSSTNDSEARFAFGIDGSLSIFGFEIDTVTRRSNELKVSGSVDFENISNERNFFGSYSHVIRGLHEWIRFALKGETTMPSEPMDAFCMTTLQEIALAFCKNPEGWSKVRNFFRAWTEVILPAGYPFMAPSLDLNGLPIDTEEEQNPENLTEAYLESSEFAADLSIYKHISEQPATGMIHKIVVQRGDGNCLFTTSSSRLGMAVRYIEEGDKLVLCAGMRLPMVLREVEGQYIVLGAAYLHGAMHGELWDEKANLLKEFKLR